MNDIQKKLKDMVVMFIATEENIEERLIDEKVGEVCGLPTFSNMSESEIDEVKASIKAEFSIKLDKGVLIQEEGHEKWFLARKSKLEMRYWERYKKYLLADKLSHRWQYAAWSVLALRILVPASMERVILHPIPLWLEIWKVGQLKTCGIDQIYLLIFAKHCTTHWG